MIRKLFMTILALFATTTLPNQILPTSADQTTNLVILNDVSEALRYSPDLIAIQKLGAITITLLSSLMQNQLVLCPKALWLSVQNIYKSWIQLNKIQKTDVSFYNNNKTAMIVKAMMLYEAYTNLQKKLSTIEEADKSSAKQKTIATYEQTLKDFHLTTAKSLAPAFHTLMAYNIIAKNEYTCKEVNDVFILFIPKDLAQSEELPDFRYKALKDFDFLNSSDLTQQNEIFQQASMIHSLGQKSLDALKTLIPPANTRHFEENKNNTHFFNFLIDGHGDVNTTAGISTKLARDAKSQIKYPLSSELLSILNFFNYQISTKTVTFSSCYPGGKKLVDTFDIKNPFNNTTLEQLNYTIINSGNFYTETFAHPPYNGNNLEFHNLSIYHNGTMIGYNDQTSNPNVKRLFSYLNTPATQKSLYQKTYEKIAQLFSSDDENSKSFLSNYVSFKFPHTAWFSPAEISTKTMTITQTQSLTQGAAPFIIPTNIKVVFLAANYIQNIKIQKQSIIKRLTFVPANYLNQNYVIDHLEIDLYPFQTFNIQSLQEKIKDFLFPLETKEPINLLIKQLTFNSPGNDSITLKDTRLFSYNNKHFWFFPDPNADDATKEIDQFTNNMIEREAKKDLKDINPVIDFWKKQSQIQQNKQQVTEQQIIPPVQFTSNQDVNLTPLQEQELIAEQVPEQQIMPPAQFLNNQDVNLTSLQEQELIAEQVTQQQIMPPVQFPNNQDVNLAPLQEQEQIIKILTMVKSLQTPKQETEQITKILTLVKSLQAL